MRIGVLAVLAAFLLTHAGPAAAYSERLRQACKNDYLSYCVGYEFGSSELKQCMRKAGGSLSGPCVNALVDAGEISASEVAKRRAAANR
jgi:adenylate kinase